MIEFQVKYLPEKAEKLWYALSGEFNDTKLKFDHIVEHRSQAFQVSTYSLTTTKTDENLKLIAGIIQRLELEHDVTVGYLNADEIRKYF